MELGDQHCRAVGADPVEDRVVELIDAPVAKHEVHARGEKACGDDEGEYVGIEPRHPQGKEGEDRKGEDEGYQCFRTYCHRERSFLPCRLEESRRLEGEHDDDRGVGEDNAELGPGKDT